MNKKAAPKKTAPSFEKTKFLVELPTVWVDKLDEQAIARHMTRIEYLRHILRPIIGTTYTAPEIEKR